MDLSLINAGENTVLIIWEKWFKKLNESLYYLTVLDLFRLAISDTTTDR